MFNPLPSARLAMIAALSLCTPAVLAAGPDCAMTELQAYEAEQRMKGDPQATVRPVITLYNHELAQSPKSIEVRQGVVGTENEITQ